MLLPQNETGNITAKRVKEKLESLGLIVRKPVPDVGIFREEFPHILEFITQVKKDDHRQMAILLQRAESKFVIEKAVSRIVEKFGANHEFISTIHDSLVVKPGMLENTLNLFKECFSEEGINPSLKISNS